MQAEYFTSAAFYTPVTINTILPHSYSPTASLSMLGQSDYLEKLKEKTEEPNSYSSQLLRTKNYENYCSNVLIGANDNCSISSKVSNSSISKIGATQLKQTVTQEHNESLSSHSASTNSSISNILENSPARHETTLTEKDLNCQNLSSVWDNFKTFVSSPPKMSTYEDIPSPIIPNMQKYISSSSRSSGYCSAGGYDSNDLSEDILTLFEPDQENKFLFYSKHLNAATALMVSIIDSEKLFCLSLLIVPFFPLFIEFSFRYFCRGILVTSCDQTKQI